ncbi:MarR family transcriptional regulator [Nocardia sp. NBC_00881]|uniref:MarR family transcriptional regulator n=1 Tax=Nocardia sp. NBC_00881 TaxID=2975995 RepID=UPI0038633E3E|nr:MarR family transcriptional regulator [Nocardia sp. NBC_00881]
MAIQRAIGYWLVELDRLISKRFDEDLATGELSRRHWQMLHSLADGPQRADDLRDALAAFWTHDSEWSSELAAVTDRGWVADDAGMLVLTEAGRGTHDQAWVRIRERRRRMVEGITDEQYTETVRVLRRMAENMAGAPSAGQPTGTPARSIG